ncbi:hypothetical protein LIER_00832 [Lithospermum erythrorhizon]|uniref:Uncharacterized protein n=1 Tax=Lithospermum erythrorhizon TaxID=34254 RepID=A0AAV3NK02_LITER
MRPEFATRLRIAFDRNSEPRKQPFSYTIINTNLLSLSSKPQNDFTVNKIRINGFGSCMCVAEDLANGGGDLIWLIVVDSVGVGFLGPYEWVVWGVMVYGEELWGVCVKEWGVRGGGRG